MTKSSTSLSKPFLFKLLRVLISLFLLKVCTPSDIPSSDLSFATLDPSTRESVIKGEPDGVHLGINIDEFEDLIIGVPSLKNHQGAVSVVSGEQEVEESLVPNFDLSTLRQGNVSDSENINKDGENHPIVVVNRKEKYPKSNHCPINCNRCRSPFSCTGCTAPYLLYKHQCVQSCPDDTFSSAGACEIKSTPDSRQLITCSTGCATCTSTWSGDCQSCEPSYHFYIASCYLPCPDSTWTSSSTTCSACPSGCSICSSATSCSACYSGYNLYSNLCYSPCPAGTYAGNSVCTACLPGCASCSSSSPCISCSAPNFLSSGHCIATCPTGTVGLNGVCQDCPANCDICSSSSMCTTCASGYLLWTGQCVQNCPVTSFNNNGVCQACPSNCDICSSSSACTTCTTLYYLSANLCVNPCPLATFPSNGVCQACPGSCNVCSDSSTCTTCASGYLLWTGQCVATCPVGTFNNNGVCQACPGNCNACSDSSTCMTCANSYFLSINQCVQTCPSGTFGDNTGQCQDCSEGCTECTSPTTCVICSSGFYLSTGVCSNCPAECAECTNLSICTTCSASYFFYTGQCLSACPPRTFVENNICQDCPLHCSSCISEKSCKTCDEGYTITNALCAAAPTLSASSQQAQQKASQAVSSAVTGAGSVLCVGSPTFPITALVSQIVQNTRYLNLTVTNELSEIYQTWGTGMISWEVPNGLTKYDNFKTSPLLFSQYGIGSSFMINFWPTFMTIVVGLGVLCISFVVKILFERGQYRGRLFSVVQRLVAGSFNFVIVQVYGCLDDILFNLVLDAKTNPFDTFFSWVSLFCAVGFLAIGCSLVYMNMRVVYRYQAIKSEALANKDMSGIEAFNQRNQYWELFYSEFNDEDFWSQSALALFIIRGTLSSLTATVFYDYPLMQTSFLVVLDGVVLLFLIFKKPFTALRGKLAQYYFETITLIVHICTFILALQDTFPTPSDTLRSILCTSILYLNTTLVTGGISFMAIEIYDIIRMKTETNKYKHLQEIADRLAAEEKSSTIQNQTTITVTNAEIEMQRKPNIISMQPLETFNLFSENNNTSLSGMSMLKPARAIDLSMNADDSVLQDIETGNEVNRQRTNQNRSPKLNRPRHRIATKKEQQQQPLEGLFLRNPTRHLRDLKKPEGLN